MATRTIIHIDLDAFYCAVEEIFNPNLRGIPFAVGGRPESRGVVSSCSYAARKLGIRSALPMVSAVKLCPELIILPARHPEYSKRSRQVMSILKKFTERIEQISIDEAFLDVSDSQIEIFRLAKTIQSEILETCGLPCSLGIASNKLVAKIATDVGKASVKTDTYPNAILIVPPGNEAEFIAPLPIETLWGVGPKTAETLRQNRGIQMIGELTKLPVQDLVKQLGKIGYDLHSRASGIDNRPIEPYREPKSYSQEITFSKDNRDKKFLLEQIDKQCQRISKSLIKANLLCSTVKIKIRWPNFSTITRQTTLPQPANEARIIFIEATKLFKNNWDGKTPIRLIGVGVSGLTPPSKQLGLWDSVDYTKLAHLEATIHQIKTKYGGDSIQKGFHQSSSPTKNSETKNG
jgi:DNA polymerase-4